MAAVRQRTAITQRDLDVLRFVRQHIERHDCAPTRREIGEALAMSRPTAEGHLQALAQHKLVRLRTEWRGISITRKAGVAPNAEAQRRAAGHFE